VLSILMVTPRALIVMPTYNERDNVVPVAEAIFKTVGKTVGQAVGQAVGEGAPEVHILFVDDGSPDGTGAILDEIAARDPRVQVMHRSGKLGLGTAYLAGFRRALADGYDFILEMDSDFSHDPRYLPDMLRRARAGADVVVGSRYVAGGGTEDWGLIRRIISRGGGFYARTVLGVPIRDLTAGFMCWRRRVLETLDLGRIRSEGYGFQIEMKYRALQAGFRIEEMPIVFSDRRIGQSKMSRKIFLEALTMVWKMRLGGGR
jgi:dolichol-phosphate mannosyltransferase